MRLSANGRSRAMKVGWLRKMAQKQKTASAWAGLPCSFSASKVSYLSAWPGEGGGWVQAWRSLLLGFQRSPKPLATCKSPTRTPFISPEDENSPWISSLLQKGVQFKGSLAAQAV